MSPFGVLVTTMGTVTLEGRDGSIESVDDFSMMLNHLLGCTLQLYVFLTNDKDSIDVHSIPYVVGDPGFEPGMVGPEPTALPLG